MTDLEEIKSMLNTLLKRPTVPLEKEIWTTVTLTEYINKHFHGSQAEFARSQGVQRQQVSRWLSKGFIVVGDTLYSSRRQLTKT